jgi:hypothetical protein
MLLYVFLFCNRFIQKAEIDRISLRLHLLQITPVSTKHVSRMDKLAIELMEDASIPGRVFFQLLSGNQYGFFSFQSIGSPCYIKGRYVVERQASFLLSKKTVLVPFECTFDAAETITIHDITELVREAKKEGKNDVLPEYIKPKKVFQIIASKFHPLLPVEKMTIEMILGTYREKREDLLHHTKKKKYVWLFRSSVQWKSYEKIQLPKGYPSTSYKLKEILFDKMLLFSANIHFPVFPSLKLISPISRENEKDEFDHTSSIRQQTLVDKLQSLLVERSVALDIFFVIIAVIVWFIFSGGSNGPFSYRYVALLLFFVAVFVISSRAFLRFVLNRWSSSNVLPNSPTRRLPNRTSSNGRSLYMNGWCSSSFCGSIRQGERLPSSLTHSFSLGNELVNQSPSSYINQGLGDISISPSYFTKNKKSFSNGKLVKPKMSSLDKKINCDFLASDMFTCLGDLQTKFGIVAGFLSQRQHFGYISTNVNYDHLSFQISGDGVVIPSSSSFTSDFLSVYIVTSLDKNPFDVYTSMSADEHEVSKNLDLSCSSFVTGDDQTQFKTGMMKSMSSFRQHLLEEEGEDEDDDDAGSYIADVSIFTVSHGLSGVSFTPRRSLNEKSLMDTVSSFISLSKSAFSNLNLFHFNSIQFVNFLLSSSSTSVINAVEQLKNDGFVSGITIAPFLCEKNSKIVKGYSEFILKRSSDDSSSFSTWFQRNSSFCCLQHEADGSIYYCLDVTNPVFRQYLKDQLLRISRVPDLMYYELDSLFSCIGGAYGSTSVSYDNRSLTKAQITQLAMKLVTDSLANKEDGNHDNQNSRFFVGNGAPLGSLLGFVHSTHVAPDVVVACSSLSSASSGQNMIRNIGNRLFLHNKWWVNHTGVLSLSFDSTNGFSDDEVIGVLTLKALSGGSVMILVTDDEKDLSKTPSSRLRFLQKILPSTSNITTVAVDFMEKEIPEFYRVIFISNHYQRIVYQTAHSRYNGYSVDGSFATPTTGNNHLMMSPFEKVLYSKKHPRSPTRYQRSMLDSLDFIEERLRMATVPLSLSDDPNLSLDSFEEEDDELDESSVAAALFPSAVITGGEIPKGTTITREMTCQGIKEKWLDKRDLLKRWFSFTICNWSDEVKTQFIKLSMIFTPEILSEFVEYTRFLYDPQRKAANSNKSGYSSATSLYNAAITNNGGKRSLSRRQLGGSFSSAIGGGVGIAGGSQMNYSDIPTPISSSIDISHILHLFNFWNESYSFKIIRLSPTATTLNNNEDETEIAFPDIPCHSAYLYSIHLSLHPLIPKYLGCNFHFSCGNEIHHIFMTETFPKTIQQLTSFSDRTLLALELQEEQQEKEVCKTPPSSTSPTSKLSAIKIPASPRGLKRTSSNILSKGGKTASSSLLTALSSSFYGPVSVDSFSPVVQTICIGFEEGMLKESSWDNFIWVFLPINIKRAKLFHQILGRITITGTAWDYSSEMEDDFNSFLPFDMASNSDDPIQIVEYIEETSCRTAGYVYKIKVSNPKNRQNTSSTEKTKEEISKAANEMLSARKQKIEERPPIAASRSFLSSAESDIGSDIGSIYPPSLSMSMTIENIGLQDRLPKPLKTRFDSNDPGITVPAASYHSPSKPLNISNVIHLQQINSGIDYLLISWISDMEEKVTKIDSPTKLF